MFAIQASQRAIEILHGDVAAIGDAQNVRERRFQIVEQRGRSGFIRLGGEIAFELGEHVGFLRREGVPIAAQAHMNLVCGRIFQQHSGHRVLGFGEAQCQQRITRSMQCGGGHALALSTPGLIEE